ncbi:Subtilisin inhibitor 1 [Dendrobium catenatum]|uniref:Subtilisin inhibitor 1 n=2 Tax=Dendrobium catenatum TaxID=906689 RepID=A0A2I0WIX8_9ASPA|nr:Subtilisin inhibitor 1 [Dendrobium catenatum]
MALLTLFLLFAFVSMAPARVKWSEVVGLKPDLAEERIRKDMPTAKFQVLKVGQAVTMDFVPWRVRIFVDSAGNVARIPVVGIRLWISLLKVDAKTLVIHDSFKQEDLEAFVCKTLAITENRVKGKNNETTLS